MTSSGVRMIVGGDSTIGSTLASYWRSQGREVYITSRRPSSGQHNNLSLDLLHPNRFTFPGVSPSHVILCASLCNIADCESNPQLATEVNHRGIVEVAKNLHALGCHILFLSTSAVFDGTKPMVSEDEPPCPRTIYGTTKADAERDLLGHVPDACILRLSKVLHPQVQLLIKWMWELSVGRPISAYNNLYLSPVCLTTVLNAIGLLSDHRASGIFHLGGNHDVTYYELAKRFALRLGASESLVQPAVQHQALNGPWASLSSTRIENLTGLRPVDVDFCIEQCLAELVFVESN